MSQTDTKRWVKIQMLEYTMKKIENLKNIFNNKSRSDTVKMSVDIAYIVAKAWENGSEVILTDRHGNEQRISLKR